MEPESRPPAKETSLDGLRGIACLVVVLDHLQLGFFSNYLTDASRLLRAFLPSWLADKLAFASALPLSGVLAVTIFWVLSGFVLTKQFHQRFDQSRLVESVLKRYFRLVIPVAASVLFCWIALHFSSNQRQSYLAQSEGNLTIWLQSFNYSSSIASAIDEALWGPFFDSDFLCNYNPVLWTMGPEFAGSLLVFALLSIFRRSRARFVGYAFIILVAIVGGRLHSVGAAAGGSAWMICFVFGTMIADLRSSRHYQASSFREVCAGRWLPALAFILCFLQLRLGYLRPVAACILVLVALENGSIRRLLSAPFIAWLGGASFAIYLLHIPLMMSVGLATWFSFERAGYGVSFAGLSASAVTIAATFALAIPFTAYVDRRAIMASARIAKWLIYCGDFLTGKAAMLVGKSEDATLTQLPTNRVVEPSEAALPGR